MENNHCILAVTADLMRCPQQECLAAGANSI